MSAAMSDDPTSEMDAPELAALLYGAAHLIAWYAALSTPEAQQDLALYGVTHHEVSGPRWTHVPRSRGLDRVAVSVARRPAGEVPEWERPVCGVSCSCCEYDDRTTACDHTRDCGLFKHTACTCDGSGRRADARRAQAQEDA